ncbi:MAG: GntR family transcriptional regulator [Acholeplasmataceae bacterium]
MIYFSMDKTSKVPLYKQIINQVEMKIRNREIKHLDQLPSESQFENIYHVSSFVVKKAYKDLEDMGYVFRIKGKGTFVQKRDTYSANAFNLGEISVPRSPEFRLKLLSQIEVDHDYQICRLLKVSCDEKVMLYKLVSLNEDLPIAFLELYVSPKLDFNIHSWILSKKNIEKYLQQHYTNKLEVVSNINAASADKILAEILYISTDDPIFVANTAFYDSDIQIAHLKTFYPGDYTYFEAITI